MVFTADKCAFFSRAVIKGIYICICGWQRWNISKKQLCAYNGYVNSIYTIAISSVNRDGSVPNGERCPGIMAVGYSRDSFGDKTPW